MQDLASHKHDGVNAYSAASLNGPERARRSEQPNVNSNVNEFKGKVDVPCRFLRVCVHVRVCQCQCQCQTGLYLCKHTLWRGGGVGFGEGEGQGG